jgi:dTDP-4-amino-4,6-dideoxygalactose transaminase
VSPIPFVDLTFQHQPLQAGIEQAILQVTQCGDYIGGQALLDFEVAFAAACTVSYGVACGTDAIALGLQACGIGSGDEVLLPANTFVATLIGVIRARATPVLVDCELLIWSLPIGRLPPGRGPLCRFICMAKWYRRRGGWI